jgi:hypothetical protein
MPDFGIFRGFNEKLFGDKLYTGQLPTELGIIGSESFGFDIDSLAFFDRVTTASGTLSATEKLAIDTLVRQMKLDGIWTKMKAIYPMVGSSAAACAQNLKSSSFTGTFTAGWTFASTGVKGNGLTTFMNTSLFLSSAIGSVNSTHYSYYTNQNVKLGSFQIGVRGTGAVDSFIGAKNNSTQNYNTLNISGVNRNSELNDVNGFLTLSRIASNEFNYYKNGSLIQTSSVASLSLPADFSVYIGALNLNGVVLNPDDARCAFASIGDGLTTNDTDKFYTSVQAFQTTLSRNV